MREKTRGFTLIEVMVAALVGGISILVAAKVAQVVIRQSAQGRERTDFHTRAQTFTRQLRADIRVAGLGSTGAIAFSNTVGALGGAASYNTANGYTAIPAVTAVSNVGAIGIGPATTQAGTDILQLVVPDPSSTTLAVGFGRAGTNVIDMQDFFAGTQRPPCITERPNALLYILDTTSPTGAGSAQLAFVQGWAVNQLIISGTFQFTVSPGARVMCARISTYWVDDQGWLHRSDVDDAGDGVTRIAGSLVMVGNAPAFADAMSPGVDDFQVALGMSADVFRRRGAAPNPATRFVFSPGGIAPPAGPGLDEWADVRDVRFNILTRTLRKINEVGGVRQPTAREDGPAPAQARSMAHAMEWVTSTEVLVSLRYYDENAAPNLEADPF